MGNQAVEIGKRNLNIKDTHWELLDLDNLKFEKPTVLCLSGNDTTTNEKANGFVKQAENYLDLMFKTKDGGNVLDNVDLVGVKYDNHTSGTCMSDTEGEKIANAILNLLVDKYGKRLDIETAQKNMSQITFFTYCMGSNVLNGKIIPSLNDKLLHAGYSPNEIDLINNATLEVSYAPFSRMNKVPSVKGISLKDKDIAMSIDAPLFDNKDNFNGVHLHQDNPGTMYEEPNIFATAKSIQIVSSNLLNTIPAELVNEHGVSGIARDKDWNLKTFIDKNTGIAYDRSPNANCVSEMMAWALCKGVENSVQNFKSDKYIPNTYWNEMMGDLQSIIDSYDREKLLSKPQDLGMER